MAVSECVRDRFFRRFVESRGEGGVRDASETCVGAFVADVIDSVDDEDVGSSEVGGEGGCLEFAEAAAACEVSAELNAMGECGLSHEEEERADGGIGKTHWVRGRGEKEED